MLHVEHQPNTGSLVNAQDVACAETDVIVFKYQSPPRRRRQIPIAGYPAINRRVLVTVNSAHMNYEYGLGAKVHQVEYLCLCRQIPHALPAQCLVGRIHHNELRRVKGKP
jgi:hypothetical protein